MCNHIKDAAEILSFEYITRNGKIEFEHWEVDTMEKFTFIGSLKNRESIFYTKGGTLAIEKDNRHLVTPTPEEKEEVYRIYPHLRPKAQAEAARS